MPDAPAPTPAAPEASAPPPRNHHPSLAWPGLAWVGAGPHKLWQGQVRKKIAPGQPGSKRWAERFGTHLVCVRYRDDLERQRRVITVELLVDEHPLRQRAGKSLASPKRQIKRPNKSQPEASPVPADAWVFLDIGWEERPLRERAMRAGGVWNPHAKLWMLPKSQAQAAGLDARITQPPAR